uniref:Peroxidase 72 n=1 Tax=Tanacetum cinerariifolium TaxID=118510 RepID=A0A699GNK9_TANCI|nr:peroxidase 72 [Tanacetum cinerariifolium]
MDVKTAFLNSKLNEKIYMKQREGFIVKGQEHKVCKLVKSLYGLKQAPKQWHEKFDNNLLSNGFQINKCDKCVYVKQYKNAFVIIFVYVDDMLIMRTNMDVINPTKKMLHSSFDMKDIGEDDVILGKSISGYVFTLGGAVVSWKSSKQTVNTRSTMEAAFVALDKATEEAEWLRSFLEGIPLWPKPVTAVCIDCDIMAALTRAKNHIYNGKSRHIRCRHNTIKDLLRNVIISIDYVKSKENIVDPLTKGLCKEQVIFTSRVEYYGIFLIGITYTRLMCGRIFGNQMAKFFKILMDKDMFTTKMNITVVAQPDSVDARVRLLLFPRYTLQVTSYMGEDDGITTLVKIILDGFTLGSFGHGGCDFRKKGATRNTNIKQCLRKVADEHFTTAVKMISSFSVSPYSDDSTSYGRDDLRTQHILDALFGEGSAISMNILKVITSFVNLWLAMRCPPILVEFVASVPLTPLFKPDNEIRPILIGILWRHFVSKVAMKGVGKEMVSSEYHNDGSFEMLTIDFLNAFNLVDRSTLFHKQGDPFRPFRFALILHPLLYKIKDSCKLLLYAWYLDDGTIIGDSEEVVRVLEIIKVSGPGLGLELNFKKTEIFCLSCNGMKLRKGLFPVDTRRSSLGVKLLKGSVSRDTNFISG